MDKCNSPGIAAEPSHADIVQAFRDAGAAKDEAKGQVQFHFASLQNRAIVTSYQLSDMVTQSRTRPTDRCNSTSRRFRTEPC